MFGNAKNISSQMLNISEILLILRTCEFTDIFITVDKICLVFTSNSKYPLFPNLLEVVNYRVLISHQPLIPVQNLSWLSVGLKSDR